MSFQTTTAWCSHCKRFSNAVCDGFSISCGKVAGDSSVCKNSSLLDGGLKNMRTKNKITSTYTSSSQASVNERIPQMRSRKNAKVNDRLETNAWCSHCKRISIGICVSCVTCGKVLGDFSEKFFPGRGKSHERERGILKIKFNRKVSTEASDQASTTTQMSSRKTKVIRHNVSLQMDDSSSEGSTTNLPET